MAEKRKPPAAGIGRKKGVPNKVTSELKEMILEALDKAGGVAYLTKQADKNPKAFMALLGRVLPLQVSGDLNITHALAERLARAKQRNG